MESFSSSDHVAEFHLAEDLISDLWIHRNCYHLVTLYVIEITLYRMAFFSITPATMRAIYRLLNTVVCLG